MAEHELIFNIFRTEIGFVHMTSFSYRLYEAFYSYHNYFQTKRQLTKTSLVIVDWIWLVPDLFNLNKMN